MGYAHFSPCEAHWTATECSSNTALEIHSEGRGGLPLLVILHGSDVSSTSTHPSAVCCPTMGNKPACLCAVEAAFVLTFLTSRLPPLASKFPVSLEHGDESACFLVLKFISKVSVCVCVLYVYVQMCVHLYILVHAHVYTWKPEISIECLPLMLSTFIFIYLCFWDRSLTEPRTHRLGKS